MPPEENQYVTYCKDRFDRIDNNFDKIFSVIEGNGSDGIKGRLGKVESTVSNQEGRWKWVFALLAAVIIAVVAAHLRNEL